jgi:hypothetical protein
LDSSVFIIKFAAKERKSMDILMYMLAIYGIVMIIWLVGAGARSAAGNLSITPPNLVNIDLINKRSKSGRCYVEDYGFYEPLKKYVAEVVCPELDCKRMKVADTKDRLEELIKAEFEYLEGKL